MSTATLPAFLQRLKQMMAAEALATSADRDLLERFLAARDDAAFQALLGRHGPMVYGVCRRVLPREQDAEDAFQATFLVLARQAGAIRKRASLASWLHGVAYRVALEAREGAARRRKHEGRARKAIGPAALPDEATWKDLRSLLDEELGLLPERLRAPLVLCYLEGLTQDEAARQLGLSKATCRRDLERGRQALAARLGRRGVTLSAALFAPLLAGGAASAALPPGLVGPTVEAAARLAARKAVTVVLSARVTALTEGVIRTMWLTKIRAAAAALLAVAVLGGGLTAYTYRAQAQDREAEKGASAPPAKPAAPQGAVDPRVKSALRDAERDAAAIKDAFNRTAAFTAIARAHARAGRREAASAVLRKGLEAEVGGQAGDIHHDNRLSILAECQAETGDLRGALETVDGAISAANRVAALRDVATARARAGDIKGALATVERMRPVQADDPYRADALQQIAVAQAGAGDTDGALKTAGRITGRLHAKAFALAAVAAARVKAGDREGAAKLVAQIRETVPETGAPRNFGLMALAETQAAVGRPQDALQTAKEITEPQWRDGALGRIAAGQAARGDVKSARRTARAIEDGYHKGQALKEVVRALIRAGDLPGAAKAAADIGDDIGRCYALMELARARAAAGQRPEAKQALDEALRLADRLENPPQMGGVREAALIHYAATRAAAGDADAALAWAGKQEDLWVRAMARVEVAEVLAGRGRD
jgi:RNA polymerase sigma factor (sigma-70 family)